MTESRRLPAPPAGSLTRLQATARQAIGGLLDLIFPPRCAGCGKLETLVCPQCEARFQKLIPKARVITPLEGLHTAFLYEEPLKKIIHAFKYDNQPRLAPVLGKHLYAAYDDKKWPATLVTAVPLHAKRLRERGYNQAGLLAQSLAKQIGIPYVADALIKTRHTEQQAHLNADERWVNVEGAYTANHVRVSGESIIIIDDVVTTGATLRQCATALIESGAARVWALTVASPSY